MILGPVGTLSGTATLTVNPTRDWPGGTMTGGGTTVLARTAAFFIFNGTEDGTVGTAPTASNRTITNNGKAYWFDDAPLTFAGGVTFNNNGEFTVLDGLSLSSQGAGNIFYNRGTFIRGGSDGSGNTIINVPFNNFGFGLVRIDTGNLTLQSGVSTGEWSIADSGSLTLAGSGVEEIGR